MRSQSSWQLFRVGVRRPICCFLSWAMPSMTWPGECKMGRPGGRWEDASGKASGCIVPMPFTQAPSSWPQPGKGMVDTKSPTTPNPRCLQVIPAPILPMHMCTRALPLTGFCVVLAPSSVEPKLPCIPSLLPLPPPQPPGRYLGYVWGGREVADAPRDGVREKTGIHLASSEMSLFPDSPREALWVMAAAGAGVQVSDCPMGLPFPFAGQEGKAGGKRFYHLAPSFALRRDGLRAGRG